MHQAQRRGATPRLRSGAEGGRNPCPKGGSEEELPSVRDEGQRLRLPDCDDAGKAERSYPMSEVGGGWVAAERSYPPTPKPKARGGGREDQPHVQGALAAGA